VLHASFHKAMLTTRRDMRLKNFEL
jgi:hypothetical protein